VLSSAHSDPALREKARSILARIIASQEPDGYVGITAKDIRTPENPLRGMDPYELYFKLHALITAYEQLGDKAALESAKKLGDYFVRTIGPDKAGFWPSDLRPPANKEKTLQGQSQIAGHAVHYGWEGTLLIDPMTRLALATGDARYTDWSKWVVGNIDTWSGWDSFSKLDQVAAGKLGIHEVQPYVHSHTFHMNFLGFLRLYEITGDASLLRKVTGAWNDIASRQMYVTGGVSVGEHYEAGHIKPVTGHVVETCATMSWLQTTQYLLELTGETRYADAMEKLLWNHVFASQAIDGETYRYHTPPNGVKPEGYYHGPDCCTSSGHRMVSMLPTFLYGKDEKGIFVNQYAASTADIPLSGSQNFRLRQDTDFPESTEILVTVESAPVSSAALRLRIPSWCAAPRLWLNGREESGVRPGTYHAIERLWKSGDTLKLTLPMELKWVRSDAPWKTIIHRLPGGEVMHQPADGDSPPWALTRGPVVYAADTLWCNDARIAPPANAGEDLGAIPDIAALRPATKPTGLIGPAYEATFAVASGGKASVLMLPFTNIGRWYRTDRPKPDRNAAAYSYAVWFQGHDSPSFLERAKNIADRQLAFANAVDWIDIGNPESEQAHKLQGGQTGGFQNRHYRHGHDFHCEIKMPEGRDGKLIVTLWGGDTGREFDILADDKLLGTLKLQANKPGEFFDETYTLPATLIQGRTDNFGRPVDRVVIRFKSRNSDVAGGIFGLRME
jgi:uncharacterized protein